MYYIVEIPSVDGNDTMVQISADGEDISCLFAIVLIENGATIVDNCYRSIAEAQEAWPEQSRLRLTT